MFEELVGATLKTPELGLRWLNKIYRNAMLTLLGIFFGYCTLIWGLSAFAGAGAITLAMWGFIFIFTFLYWQPLLGQLGALVEWRVKSDDPNMKSTWRLYLMVLIAAIVVGRIAIGLHLIGSKQLFPLVALVAFTYVLYALLTPGRDLDKVLAWVAGTLLTLAIVGTYYELNPPTKSQKLASEIKKSDISRQDLLLESQVRTYVKPLLECNTPKNQIATWKPNQFTVYHVRCNESNSVRVITLEELKEYWPREHNIWLNSQKSLVAGGGTKNAPISFTDDPIGWMKQNLWLTIVILGHIPLFILIKRWWNGTTAKTEEVEKTTANTDTRNYSGLMWLTLILLVGYGLYHYREPLKTLILTTNGNTVRTATSFNPSLSALEVDRWKAQYTSKNFHIKMPQDVWHGQFVAVQKGSYVTNTVHLAIRNPADQNDEISLNGNCVTGTKYVPKVCDGYWNAGNGLTGIYKLVWDDPQGRTFLVKMYKEQIFDSDGTLPYPIREIRFLDKVMG